MNVSSCLPLPVGLWWASTVSRVNPTFTLRYLQRWDKMDGCANRGTSLSSWFQCFQCLEPYVKTDRVLVTSAIGLLARSLVSVFLLVHSYGDAHGYFAVLMLNMRQIRYRCKPLPRQTIECRSLALLRWLQFWDPEISFICTHVVLANL